jgi:hypothetical protein
MKIAQQNINLHVTLEWDSESQAMTISIVHDGKTLLGQLRLPLNRATSLLTLRENRDAIAGVFLASVDSAAALLRKSAGAER